MNDTCIICGQETEYSKKTPVGACIGYIEGAGQLCREHDRELYGACR